MSKLKWQCRRGTLELDVLLQSFLSEKYPNLSEQEKLVFVELLACSDQELMSWFFGDETPASQELKNLVDKIKILAN